MDKIEEFYIEDWDWGFVLCTWRETLFGHKTKIFFRSYFFDSLRRNSTSAQTSVEREKKKLVYPPGPPPCASGQWIPSLGLKQRRRRRKRHLKKAWLYRAYSISFNSSNVGKFLWSWIVWDCIKVQEKKKKIVFLCSRPRQNQKLGTFTL